MYDSWTMYMSVFAVHNTTDPFQGRHTLSLVVNLGEEGFADSTALVIESFGAGHARRRGARAGGGRASSCAGRRRATGRRPGVANAIGVVPWAAVHVRDEARLELLNRPELRRSCSSSFRVGGARR